MFKKLLIANRGEIACRIIKTAHRLGIRTVAVFSDADANALHVKMANEAIHIGPPAAVDSYLNAEKIIAAALKTGAEAIHPGYGFLSENPDFAESVSATGLTFVGPTAEAIRAMGLKDAAKSLMEQAGVPIVPGYHGHDQSHKRLMAEAEAIGYPVLIKARAGGGGKGMRRVDTAEEFLDALEGAQREAAASFGDSSCLIESYIAQPRHIEVQIFGDQHGQVVHMFERDCSLQRRHQKVVEEAPAPDMPQAVREAMGAAAVNAAHAIGYVGAGTVEFIADGTDGLRTDRFWFMEMNTRLQVEHPISEAITGLDFVELQLRIAAGQPLPVTQDSLAINGWAFEARLYAEDVCQGFLPMTGRLQTFTCSQQIGSQLTSAQQTGEFADGHIRIDSGVSEGDLISPWYDPMIAKVIAHGPDRDSARRRLASALEDLRCFGTTTNLAFLRKLIADPDVALGKVDTGLIARNISALSAQSPPSGLHLAVAAMHDMFGAHCQSNDPWWQLMAPQKLPNHHRQLAPKFALWSHWGHPAREMTLISNGQAIEIKLTIHESNKPHIDVSIEYEIEGLDVGSFRVQCQPCDAERHHFECCCEGRTLRAEVIYFDSQFAVFCDGDSHIFERPNYLQHMDDDLQQGDAVLAPMPGFVKLIHVETGANVAAGDPVLVLEAMKMEHTLKAPRTGSVEAIHVAIGDQVSEGTLLLALDENSNPHYNAKI